jgi:hypothetical protein
MVFLSPCRQISTYDLKIRPWPFFLRPFQLISHLSPLHIACASSSKGPRAQGMSKFQKILVKKPASSKGQFRPIWALTVRWLGPNELLQKILELGLSGSFPNRPFTAYFCHFVCIICFRWTHFTVCWNRLRTITVQLWDKIILMVSPRSTSTVTMHEGWISPQWYSDRKDRTFFVK